MGDQKRLDSAIIKSDFIDKGKMGVAVGRIL
jgi:hypothetical protein